MCVCACKHILTGTLVLLVCKPETIRSFLKKIWFDKDQQKNCDASIIVNPDSFFCFKANENEWMNESGSMKMEFTCDRHAKLTPFYNICELKKHHYTIWNRRCCCCCFFLIWTVASNDTINKHIRHSMKWIFHQSLTIYVEKIMFYLHINQL